jgi:hypothetical protein
MPGTGTGPGNTATSEVGATAGQPTGGDTTGGAGSRRSGAASAVPLKHPAANNAPATASAQRAGRLMDMAPTPSEFPGVRAA